MSIQHTPRPSASRAVWAVSGALLIASVVLTFVGNAFQPALMLGDPAHAAREALMTSSMSKVFTGGYIEVIGALVELVALLGVARLLRSSDESGGWLSSVMAAAAAVTTALALATGFAAGAAALYNGHHGASLDTVRTVNDIRNMGFFLSGAVNGVFAIAACIATVRTRRLPVWIGYLGGLVGVAMIAAVPAARTGFINVTTLAWFAWLLILGVAALRGPSKAAHVGADARQPVAV